MTAGPIDSFIRSAGMPYLPVERVAATMLCVATHPDENTSGLAWTLPDGGRVFRMAAPGLNAGVYALLNGRSGDLVEAAEQTFGASFRSKL